jgi:predicted transglutaminase-like cysteine proteinase
MGLTRTDRGVKVSPILLSVLIAFTVVLNSATAKETYRTSDPQQTEQTVKELTDLLHKLCRGCGPNQRLTKNHTPEYQDAYHKQDLKLPDKIIQILKNRQAIWKKRRASDESLLSEDVDLWDANVRYPTRMLPELRRAELKAIQTEDVNRWVNDTLMFKESTPGWRTPQQSFTETIEGPDGKQHLYGDSKDFVIAKAAILHHLGFKPQEMIILVGVLKSGFDWKGGHLAVKTKLPWAMEHPLGGPRKSAAPHIMLGVRAACSRFPGLKGRKTGCQGAGFPDWEFLDIYGKDPPLPTGPGGEHLAPESIKGDQQNVFDWGDPDFPFVPMVVLTNKGAYNMINYTTGDWGSEGQKETPVPKTTLDQRWKGLEQRKQEKQRELNWESKPSPSLHQLQGQQIQKMKNTPNYNEHDWDDEGN